MLILKEYIQNILFESISYSKDVNHEYINIIDDFVNFCQNELNIKTQPAIEIVNIIKNGTHGVYHPDQNKINVVHSGRHIADILRSIAHEFVHHLQNEENRIDDTGLWSKIEDEANMKAAILVKKFGRLNNNKIYY